MMEVENDPKWKETHIGDTPMFRFFPWLRKNVYKSSSEVY